LVECLDGRLDTDGQLEVFNHVERCDVCFEAMFELVRERNLAGYERRPERAARDIPLRRAGRYSGAKMRGAGLPDSPAACGRREKRMLSAKARNPGCRASAKSG
jgi:hypothetical protein